MTLIGLLAQSTTSGAEPPATYDPPVIEMAMRNIAYSPKIIFSNWTTPATRTATISLEMMRDAESFTVTFSADGDDVTETTWESTVNGIQITFSGDAVGRVAPTEREITSDPVPLPVKTGDVLEFSTTATGWRISNAEPSRVNALSDKPSVLVIGSSSGVPESFTRGMRDAGLPVVNGSTGGSRASTFTSVALSDRFGLSGDHGFTHAFLQVGTNSLDSPYASQLAVELAWRLRSLGVPYVAQKVWKPWTTSTDGWTTVEGQLPKHKYRAGHVAWLRRGAPVSPDGKKVDEFGALPDALYVGQVGHPFDAIVDWSRLLEADTNEDVFRVAEDGTAITADGLHLQANGYELGRPAIREWAEGVASAYM